MTKLQTITPPEERNKYVAIEVPQQPARSDANGQTICDWTLFCQCWVKIKPLSGRELWLAKQAQARVTHEITMLYQPGIDPTMRAVLGERIFNFDSVRNKDEQNLELIILAIENV
jgi:SPP1 family predicted phage head-tail adaptor